MSTCPHCQRDEQQIKTYSVEGDNAELRHYLARLGRKSRCFSRCIRALWRAVKLFVYSWNRRQLHKRAYPTYPAPWLISLAHDFRHSRYASLDNI